ncbi:type II toxin-antitoxin system HipA family toxin [Microvirga brassicacearum]|uniref:HipA domain-containing protein n=1 Tax=Microvirga brassicacearum TaxID=2580413 RepID=A0A5N3PDT2_9HYPH|nr:HipA domain-containing protein [Microvirga brassicacearum]KAB0267871.1 HipA domain-containing protein [Microvirga brassicacearum]
MWRVSSSGRLDHLTVFKAADGRYVAAGELTFEGRGSVRPGRFRYAREYLERPEAAAIDPINLPRVRRSFAGVPEVPLACLDAGPEGFGRNVLAMAFEACSLGAGEFLALGSSDRTGDLAFGASAERGPGIWRPEDLSPAEHPMLVNDLEALMAAAMAADEGRATADELALLVRTSADVGGARPKVRWRDGDGEWIAKFPTWSDRFDDPRVEAVCLDVAAAAGIPVPERRLVTITGRSVLLVRRFDRSETGRPFGYLSFGTLLTELPGSYGTTKTYADMVAVARSIGVPAPETDIFRRLLVNAFLHNTDDHLRNHAVINKGSHWELSPAFDIVPYLGRKQHVCAPAPGISAERDVATAFSTYPAFGLKRDAAEQVLDEVRSAALRLPDFMDQREVSGADRALLNPLLTSS